MAMARTGHWVFSQDVPTDVVVVVGEANFPLHKLMLVAKSNLVRKMILDSKEAELTRIDLSDIPGGPGIFEKAAMFCYGVNFEITVRNVAALRCAAEYLQMTGDGNLAGRTEDFLSQVALTTLSGALVVLQSCEDLLPVAEDLRIVQRCIEIASAKACVESNFPSHSPPNWWTEELTILDITFFSRLIASMKTRGAKGLTLASAIITYTERSLHDLLHGHFGNKVKTSDPADSKLRSGQQKLLESIVTLLPPENSAFPVNFLCCLLRTAIFLMANTHCQKELEKRISTILEHVAMDDLLVLSFTYDGEKISDLESVRRIVSKFIEKEKNVAVFNTADLKEVCSKSMQTVTKTIDAYLAEIATHGDLSISKFNGIASLAPKAARKGDDDLYRAIDIYLKAHPELDEIEREKVCSAMDPLKLSYEARVHASQNKRLPVQIVLHALYYDQLQLRSGGSENKTPNALTTRNQLQADVTLVKENEELRTELLKMKMYIQDIQSCGAGTSSKASSVAPRKVTFFSSVSKKLGRLNPFKNGSKDTANLGEGMLDLSKPRRRRFSIS